MGVFGNWMLVVLLGFSVGCLCLLFDYDFW